MKGLCQCHTSTPWQPFLRSFCQYIHDVVMIMAKAYFNLYCYKNPKALPPTSTTWSTGFSTNDGFQILSKHGPTGFQEAFEQINELSSIDPQPSCPSQVQEMEYQSDYSICSEIGEKSI